MGFSSQIRMYGDLSFEGFCSWPSVHIPTDSIFPADFSSESCNFSYAHYSPPIGEIRVLHGTSKPFLLLYLQECSIFPDPLDPMLWTSPAPDPCYSCSLIMCLSLSEDLSTSLQIVLHPCSASISRDITIQNPGLSSLIISVSMPPVYGHTLEMATLLKAWFKLPICLVPFSSTHFALISFSWSPIS